MADATRTIQMIFEGSDQTSKVIDKIGGNLDAFGSGLEDIASPFAGIANTILAVDAAILAVGATILKIRDDFNGATAKINASVNGTAEEIEALDSVVKKVFSNNFGESADDVARAVIRIQTQFKDLQLSVEDIQFAAESAFSLSDLWDADIEGSLGAVKSLMDNFGLTIQESFDFISSGFSEGLNSSGDFLESVTEYSTQFKDGGANAGQFFSVLETGLAEGMLGTDKAADAFKEFRLRITEGGEEARKALGDIGINADEFAKNIANGSLTAVDAFQKVIDGLRGVDDKTVQYKAGVALLGSQFEDLGTSASLTLDTTKTKMADLAGATEKTQKQYDTLSNSIETIFRAVSTGLSDVKAFDGLEKQLDEFLKNVSKNLPEAFGKLDWSGIVGQTDELVSALSDLFGGIDITTVEGMTKVMQDVLDTVETFIDITGGMAEAWGPAIQGIVFAVESAVEAFNSLDSETKELIGNFLGIAQQAVIVGGAISSAGLAISGFSALIAPATAGIAALIGGATTGGLVGLSAVAGVAAGSLLREYVPAVDDAAQGMIGWIDSIVDFSGTQGRANETIEEASKRLDKERSDMLELAGATPGEAGKALDDLAGKSPIDITVEAKIDNALDDFFGEIDSISADNKKVEVGMSLEEFRAGVDEIVSFTDSDHTTTFGADVDRSQLEFVTGIIEETLPDGTRSFTYQPEINQQAFDDAAKAIEEKIPAEKVMKIETDLQIAQIEAQSKQIESFLEYKAKVDVAEIEAAAETIKALAEGASEAFQSTGDVISSIFGDLAGLGNSLEDTRTRWSIEDQLEIENDLRERSLEIQEKLTKAQLEYLKARTKRLESGESLITVNIDSKFDYALRLLAEQFLAEAQILATEEGKEYLLGLMTPAAA